MEVKILFVLAGLSCLLLGDVQCSKVSQEKDFPARGSEHQGASDPEFYDSFSTGSEMVAMGVMEIVKNELEEEKEMEKLSESEVDEETIRKAEKMADEDLLNGLNRILKNNETLKDVLRTENVDEIP